MAKNEIALPRGYGQFLDALKQRVRDAQVKAQRTVNTQLIELYWHIGNEILTRQDAEGWGSGVLGRLAEDLAKEFSDMKGLSRTNLQYMRAFAAAWPDSQKVPQAVGLLPWGHIRLLLDRFKSTADRDRYAAAAVEYGWSRNVLMNHIMNRTLERSGGAPSNFTRALPAPESELVQQISKDPYNLEFLGLTKEAAERDLEQALTDRIVETLRELGPGFAFVGRQVHVDVDGDDFYIDCSDSRVIPMPAALRG
ncbi:PDDEXK nuclease domain-containing protein [Arthrobacter crystallopoietes]|uniref:PDDEXK nuclease domain-containing protein n=1 Tax=Crystallibacter crystallopoietes TaxID=37928 RepID=UPI00094473A9|nr:PDDEXK nuclease domain-containing protein [Arthrobacter crystallopoietes]